MTARANETGIYTDTRGIVKKVIKVKGQRVLLSGYEKC